MSSNHNNLCLIMQLSRDLKTIEIQASEHNLKQKDK